MVPFNPWHCVLSIGQVMAANVLDAPTRAGLARRRLDIVLRAAQRSGLNRQRLAAAQARVSTRMADGRGTCQTEAGLPLEAIEPLTRAELMARFDESVTDPAIRLESVRAFIADPDRVGDAYLGRHAVWTSSGSTGSTGIFVHDTWALSIYDALDCLRLCGGPLVQDSTGWPWTLPPVNPLHPGFAPRLALLAASNGHFAGVASLTRLMRLTPTWPPRIQIISILQPIETIVESLNRFQPEVIASYPSAAGLLAQEQLNGRLNIAPRAFWLGGEQSASTLHETLKRAFNCQVREAYGASEFLSIGWSCDEGVVHINDDWVVLEPVDEHYRPVEPGQRSHTVLLTNLANQVQPLIRYDLGDSLTFLGHACRCGSSFPAVTIEGRRDEVIAFEGKRGMVQLLPLALVTVLEDEANAINFQLIARDTDTLELRLDLSQSSAALDTLRAACHRVLGEYLNRCGLDQVLIVDGLCSPVRDARSGKVRRVINACAR